MEKFFGTFRDTVPGHILLSDKTVWLLHEQIGISMGMSKKSLQSNRRICPNIFKCAYRRTRPSEETDIDKMGFITQNAQQNQTRKHSERVFKVRFYFI